MKANELMTKVGRTVNKIGFSLKKHSPEILVVSGVIGAVASTVMACKATLKVNDILEEHKETMDKIYEAPTDDPQVYSEDDKKKDTVIVYTQTAVKLVKLYGPAVILGTLSVSSILASNNILRKRNAALAAAYAAIDRSFAEYRNRVVERFGEEVDHQLRYNVKAQEIEETIVDEKGKEKKVKKTVEVADPNAESIYQKYFTRTNPNWENDSDFVETFLRMQQNYANDLLRANGHLTLNKVYDMLGFQDTKAGMVVGWVYDLDHPNGDNYVEFNVKKVHLPNERGGLEEAYTIDFNVDGNIYDLMV